MSQRRPEFYSLSIAERIQLAEDIWDSIAAENPDSVLLSPEQRQEIRARATAHDENPASAFPGTWFEVGCSSKTTNADFVSA